MDEIEYFVLLELESKYAPWTRFHREETSVDVRDTPWQSKIKNYKNTTAVRAKARHDLGRPFFVLGNEPTGELTLGFA
jgi:hypothetical protein